ncbi:hypothetical protein [Ferruginibacter sp.]|uniref:hypothetical protein n=1 Tax=Ferruginibacter sp. TaxID=1940288 RepID=UPI002658E794|nr:hypothetical protein [Ferruginibacter sp.]
MESNLWGEEYTHPNIDEKSTDIDKLNAVINVFAKNQSPDYVEYEKLFLFSHTVSHHLTHLFLFNFRPILR